jgi:DNA-binding PadR family transcriptional regulator
MIRCTTLDYIILGLLQQEPLTGYRIRKSFEETALGNFGGSPGTIYPALNRLTKNGLVIKIPIAQSEKFQFSITAPGLKMLKEWLGKIPEKEEVQKNLNLLILKFAFMDPHIDRYHKLDFLQNLLNESQDYLDELENYYVHEKESMPLNAQLSFEYGLLSYSTTISWCENAMEQLLLSEQDF